MILTRDSIVNLKTIVDHCPQNFENHRKTIGSNGWTPKKTFNGDGPTLSKPLKNHWRQWWPKKKTLTIPSPWKIDHRCGLIPAKTILLNGCWNCLNRSWFIMNFVRRMLWILILRAFVASLTMSYFKLNLFKFYLGKSWCLESYCFFSDSGSGACSSQSWTFLSQHKGLQIYSPHPDKQAPHSPELFQWHWSMAVGVACRRALCPSLVLIWIVGILDLPLGFCSTRMLYSYPPKILDCRASLMDQKLPGYNMCWYWSFWECRSPRSSLNLCKDPP